MTQEYVVSLEQTCSQDIALSFDSKFFCNQFLSFETMALKRFLWIFGAAVENKLQLKYVYQNEWGGVTVWI